MMAGTGFLSGILRAGAPPSAVRIRHLNHSFGAGDSNKQVLFNIELDLAPGEIVIMTGPSGSGKTTLLTLIGALRTVQEGALEVLGLQLYGMSDRELIALRRQIGFIFQGHNLFRSLSALQNVKTALQLNAMNGRKMDDLAAEMLREVGLGNRIDYRPDALSGGQRQRVAIARALVNRPKLILADEPTAALDRESGRQVVSLLQNLAKEQGSTILIVTHDNRILDAADRIVNMVDGQIASNVLVAESLIICEFLKKCPSFASLAPDALTDIADKMFMERHPSGGVIIRQGEVGDKFYLIREGSVDVYIGDGIESRHVRSMGEGEFFGEIALMTDQPRTATVIAKENVMLYALSKADFKATLEASSSFGEQLRKVFFLRQ
ncbi:MAG TPA: ATP-binding cassette domain-containing protein [Blastocatellia bacterium]|nr:ATP-binding cassette domain-containing protein [Blastocatellia bacterium]